MRNNNKILFVDPPSLSGGAQELAGASRLSSPNLGLIYIASYLKQKTDAQVLFVDINTEGLTFEGLGAIVKKFDPALVGISCKTFNILLLQNCRDDQRD